jgi:hypothetical protein
MRTDEPQNPDEKDSPGARLVVAEPDFSGPPKPIADLVVDPEFPKSALGQHVDIGGYAGVVVEIVKGSLKVRSLEGVTKSFNAPGLRRIYGPAVRPEPLEAEDEKPRQPLPDPVSRTLPKYRAETPPAPKRDVISEPDFTKPVRNIVDFINRPGFPKSTFGEHLEIGGYTGVVVEIVNRSLKVRSQSEMTRSYNADVLQKLYGKK